MKRKGLNYSQLVKRYKRYWRKLQRIEEGTCQYSGRNLIIKRMKQILKQITELRATLKLATAGTALTAAMLMSAPTVSAQNLVLRTDNILGVVNIEGVAKPRAVDFDGDGDIDLFIGGKLQTTTDIKSANVLYFENIGGVLQAAPSPFPDTLNIDPILIDPALKDTAEVSPAFVDYDGDSDLDAFIGLADSTILYYRNDGGTMVGVVGTDNPFDGIKTPDASAVPAFYDADGDGDMDAVIGKRDGYLAYYQNDSGAFVLKTDAENPFDGINVGNNSSPAFADLDGDSDMDLFIGNKDGVIAYYQNDAGAFTQIVDVDNPFNAITAESIGTKIAPSFGDIDGDGDLDAFFGNNDGLVNYFENDGGVFTEIPFNPLGINDFGGSANNALVDIDADGDLDLFTGDGDGFVFFSVRDSSGFVAQDSANNPLNTGVVKVDYIASPSFADIDGDGDLDAFVGSYMSNIIYLRNDSAGFVQDTANNPFKGIDPGNNEDIAFIDWDNDSDLDAFIANKAGEVRYFENAAGVFMEITGAGNPFDGVSFQTTDLPNWTTAIAFADIDGDGDMDAYVGTNNGFIRYFDNDAGVLTEKTGVDNPFDGWDFGRAASPEFGDIDGDGDTDLLVSNAQGLTYYFENTFNVGIKDAFKFSTKTNVFPNPSADLIRIEMDWNLGPASVTLRTISGQEILTSSAFGTQAYINMGNIPAGIYLLTISGEAGNAVKKIIKK